MAPRRAHRLAFPAFLSHRYEASEVDRFFFELLEPVPQVQRSGRRGRRREADRAEFRRETVIA